jgi:hypothetical protein
MWHAMLLHVYNKNCENKRNYSLTVRFLVSRFYSFLNLWMYFSKIFRPSYEVQFVIRPKKENILTTWISVTIHNIGFNHNPFKQHARNAYMMVNTVQRINAFDIKENARKMEMCYSLLSPRTHIFPPLVPEIDFESIYYSRIMKWVNCWYVTPRIAVPNQSANCYVWWLSEHPLMCCDINTNMEDHSW